MESLSKSCLVFSIAKDQSHSTDYVRELVEPGKPECGYWLHDI